MKKTAILFFPAVITVNAAKAQFYTVSDTLMGRSDNYYYEPEYKNCPWFNEYSTTTYHANYHESERTAKLGLIVHTDRRMAVKGIAAMVTTAEKYIEISTDFYFNSPNPGKKAEYVYLCTGDTSWLHVRDSARWDTLTPRLWKFPATQDTLDTTSFLYANLFETYFSKPLLVDSSFILAGSFNSNSNYDIKTYWPTSYGHVSDDYDICNWGCNEDSSTYLYIFYDTSYINQLREDIYAYLESIDSLDYYKDSIESALDFFRHWRMNEPGLGHLGPFFAIVDFYQLEVTVDDNQKGWAWGGGRFPDRSLDTITARSKEGYCFVQWDDGNTDNPRIVDLTQDTLFTAVFDTCTLHDIAAPDQLPFTVVPNPTSGTVIIGTPSDGNYQLALYDMAGRCLVQTSFNGTSTTLDLGALAAGSYQLALRSAGASGIKVIIKK